MKTSYSGYYNYDERYVKINGQWMYRLALLDIKNNFLATEKISKNSKLPTCKNLFKRNYKTNIPLIAITTDSKPYYRSITDKLNVKHQLGIFHFKKRNKYMDKKNYLKEKIKPIKKN